MEYKSFQWFGATVRAHGSSILVRGQQAGVVGARVGRGRAQWNTGLEGREGFCWSKPKAPSSGAFPGLRPAVQLAHREGAAERSRGHLLPLHRQLHPDAGVRTLPLR